MDEILWCIKWSAALTPELAMIPDRSVFLRSSPGHSFTATVEGITSDVWETWEHAGNMGNVGNVGNANNPNVADDADVVSDVEEVEGICYCTTHEPSLENKVLQDRVLFV